MQQANSMGKNDMLRKGILRWGGLLGAFGGLIWAILFYMEATAMGFNLRYLLQNQPIPALVLFLSVAFQAAGFYSLSDASKDFSIPRISAVVCSLGALGQSLAILAVSTFIGLGAAWLLGILGELVITIALGIFAISSLSSKLPLTVKLFPFLMVPFYFFGWALDPGTQSTAGPDFINLSAATYGLLWIPFGYTVWNYWRNRFGIDQSSQSTA
jgi:hypothetical protein